MSLHANISNMPFDQKSPWPQEEGVLNCLRQTDWHTDGHGDSMTELAQWANSVKIIRISQIKFGPPYFLDSWFKVNIISCVHHLKPRYRYKWYSLNFLLPRHKIHEYTIFSSTHGHPCLFQSFTAFDQSYLYGLQGG